MLKGSIGVPAGLPASTSQLQHRACPPPFPCTCPVLPSLQGLTQPPCFLSSRVHSSRRYTASASAWSKSQQQLPDGGLHPMQHPPLLPSVLRRKQKSIGRRILGKAASADGSFAQQPSDENNLQENSTSKQQAAAEKGMPHRWKVVIMMAVAFVLCNMDKVNMSVAVIPMAHELGWSALDRGLVSSSFFWGYTATQMPGGYIATQIGGTKVLGAGVALWSFGTLIAPPAAQMGILWLCASRALVGLGEGVAPSAATTILARLMPSTERARAVSLVWGGLDVGSAVGLLLSGPLIRCFGWPSVFYLFACLGLIWCCFWPVVKKDGDTQLNASPVEPQAPNSSGQVAAASSTGSSTGSIDTKNGNGNGNGNGGSKSVPWGAMFRSSPVWAVTCAHFCFNWGYYTLLAWLPSYFELALGLNVEKSSILTLIPYVAMIAMMPLVGPIADSMVERGMPLTRVRKICQGIAFLGPAACMVGCALLTPYAIQSTAAAAATQTAGAGVLSIANPTIIVLVLLMSAAFALSAWSRAGLYCNHQDLSPQYAGA
ncbi:major facilitator superfamily domain-containing protein [Dunaliella salina]|uniref:Major facilitator superfamily domain-containing protein n=1 Tax=Dunaliella salina TaxID=3046 RepID=A0ABQ7H1I3_DUNSA|nr:major facilitator superfamily domain-containing protein [Dunaliella salina]|eukprot:KAF5840713.1 major facilitator superfamily domain-containing protein [Dunaliella salina]